MADPEIIGILTDLRQKGLTVENAAGRIILCLIRKDKSGKRFAEELVEHLTALRDKELSTPEVLAFLGESEHELGL